MEQNVTPDCSRANNTYEAATARPARTGINAARYAADPCKSVFNPSALTLTPAAAAWLQSDAKAASTPLARNTPEPAPVTATRTPDEDLLTNTPTSENREAGCLNFYHAAFSGMGKLTEVITSPSPKAVSYKPLKKSSAAMLRRSVWIVAPSPMQAAG